MAARITAEQAVAVVRAVGYEPLEPYPGPGRRPWKVRCVGCGSERIITYDNARQGNRCRVCSGYLKRSDETTVPVMRAAGLEPLVPYPGFDAPWLCRCVACGHDVTPSYGSVRRGQGGCVYCSKRVVDPDVAVATMRAAGFEPQTPYSGHSRQPWPCVCVKCRLPSTPSYNSVTSRATVCKFCAKVVVAPADAVNLMEARGLIPLEPYPGATRKWRCRCADCGHEVTPTYSDVRSKHSGCAYCADYGFQPGAPGRVYLMVNEAYDAIKIGKTTTTTKGDRLVDHQRQGWATVRVWDVPTGADATAIEERIKHWWRDELGLSEALTGEEMPQRGYTETARQVDMPRERAISRIELEVARQLATHPSADNSSASR